MKTSFALAACLSAIFFVTGCQKSSPPAPATAPSRVVLPQENTSMPSSQEQANEAGAGHETDSDAADPGMTTDHDKTVEQEQPSGDESSRAAPNDGDAEPPQ